MDHATRRGDNARLEYSKPALSPREQCGRFDLGHVTFPRNVSYREDLLRPNPDRSRDNGNGGNRERRNHSREPDLVVRKHGSSYLTSPIQRTGYLDPRNQHRMYSPERGTRERELFKPRRDYHDSSHAKDVSRPYHSNYYADRENRHWDRTRSQRDDDPIPPLPKQKFSTDYRMVRTPPPDRQRYASGNDNRAGEYRPGRYGTDHSTNDTKRAPTDEQQVETARKRWRQAWDTDLLDERRQHNETATQAVKDNNKETRRIGGDVYAATRDHHPKKEYREQPENGYFKTCVTSNTGHLRRVELGEIIRNEESIRSKSVHCRVYSATMLEQRSGNSHFVNARIEGTTESFLRGTPKLYDMADAFLQKVAGGMETPSKSYNQTRNSLSISPYKPRARSRSPVIRNRERGRSPAPRAQRNGSPSRGGPFSQFDSAARNHRSNSNKSYDRRWNDQAFPNGDHKTDKRHERLRSRDEFPPTEASYVGRHGTHQSSPGPTRKYSVDHRDRNHRREPVVYSVDHRVVKQCNTYSRDRPKSSTLDRNREFLKRSPSRGRSNITGKEGASENQFNRGRKFRSRSVEVRESRSKYDRDMPRGDGRGSLLHHGGQSRERAQGREFERTSDRNRDSSSLQTRRNKDDHYEKFGNGRNALDRGKDGERNSNGAYLQFDGNFEYITDKNSFDRQPYVKRETELWDRDGRLPGTYDRTTDKDVSRVGNVRVRDLSPMNKNAHHGSGTRGTHYPADRFQKASSPTTDNYRRHSSVSLDTPNSLERRPSLVPQRLSEQHFYPASYFSQIPKQEGSTNPAYSNPDYSMLIYQSPTSGKYLDPQEVGNYSGVRVLTQQNRLVPMPTPTGIYVATPMVNHPPSQILNPPVFYLDRGGKNLPNDSNVSSMFHVMGSGQPVRRVPASAQLPQLVEPTSAVTFLPNPVSSRTGYLNRYEPSSQDPHALDVTAGRSVQYVVPNIQTATEPTCHRPGSFGWPMIEYVDGLMNRLQGEIRLTPQPDQTSKGDGTVPIREQVNHSERTQFEVLTIDTKMTQVRTPHQNLSLTSTSTPTTSLPLLQKNTDATSPTNISSNPVQSSSPATTTPPMLVEAGNTRIEISPNRKPPERDPSVIERHAEPNLISASVTPVEEVVKRERMVYNETDRSVEELRAEHAYYQC